MIRRLYFLFPSTDSAQAAVSTLTAKGISKHSLHAVARKDVDLSSLPVATRNQRRNVRARLARGLWDGDLLVFAIAFVGLVASLYLNFTVGWVLATIVMIASFIGGAFYAMRVPEVSLAEFRAALTHNEVLLMVDVPLQRLTEIEDLVRHRHPDAEDYGSSWTLDAFGI